MNQEKELPSFIYWGGITGLVMLGISLILYAVFFTLYNEAEDTRATLTRPKMSETEFALMISYIVVGVVGYGFCFLIPYGHYLKSFNDPSVVSTKNGLHFEAVNPDIGSIKAVDIVKPPSLYATAGSGSSDLVPKGISNFAGKKIENYL